MTIFKKISILCKSDIRLYAPSLLINAYHLHEIFISKVSYYLVGNTISTTKP